MAGKICGQCKFYLVRDVCPRAEYKDYKLNTVACCPTDKACPLFKAKYKNKNSEELEMSEALELLNKHIYKCPIDTEKVLVYNEGIYEKAKPLIWNILESEYGNDLKRHFVDEAYAHLQRANTIKREEINRYINKIPIKNGLFNFITRDIEPFDPEQVYTYKLNVEYDLEAKCPKWLEFVKEIVEPDAIPLLQEIMGYCLLPAMPYHKMFWFYGTGRNGKGVVIRTQEAILGKDNCGSLNLGEFRESRRFSLAQLYGKLINVSSEPPLSKYGLPTTILKMVTGQDTISAELKNKNERLVFTNFSKLLVLGNHFPKIDDPSLGWWDRVVPLNFPNSFEGEKNIPNIEKRWVPEELNGIFNWILEGLYRINTNNGFSTSKSVEETKAEFMRQSDGFKAWIIERCVKIPTTYLINEEALTAYFEYCDDIGADRDSKRTFYEKMRREPQVTEKQKMISGQNKRVFQGITLRTEDQEQTNLAVLASLAVSPTRQSLNNPNNVQDKKAAISAKTANFDIDETFRIKCYECGATINKNEVYSFGGKPFCRACRLKIEVQKKKEDWNCPQLSTLDGDPFCKILQSILAMPEQCEPDCSLLKEESSE